jgi:phytoene dehydrogenase-like protein
VVLLDVGPQQLVDMAGEVLPRADRLMVRAFRWGPGVSKVDWALAEPVPWSAPECRQAVTIHLGGTASEIAAGEREVAAGRHPTSPYCIVVQPTVLDPTRAPSGRHTLWAYCHVPSGSTFDMVSRIEAQIERFAPGFRDTVIARHSSTAAEVARHNPNYLGGDIGGGALSVRRILGGPFPHRPPYRTGVPGVYLCSASTPPGPGVHGMCGFHAASAVLEDERSGRLPPRHHA